jgi:hypothetical protein
VLRQSISEATDDVAVRSFVLTFAERRARECLREPECATLA